MIAGLSVLALVTARGGSKRLPGKNLKLLGDKPLLAWTAEAVLASEHIDRHIISSEDEQIIACAREWGLEAPFTRPKALARDSSPHAPVITHALDNLNDRYDLLVLLQPTSPLRTAGDIDGCLGKMTESSAPACVSVTPARKSPSLYFRLSEQGNIRPVIPANFDNTEQYETQPTFCLNGAVYASHTSFFLEHESFISDETIAYVMPPERSIDIDDELDFMIAEMLAGRKE